MWLALSLVSSYVVQGHLGPQAVLRPAAGWKMTRVSSTQQQTSEMEGKEALPW